MAYRAIDLRDLLEELASIVAERDEARDEQRKARDAYNIASGQEHALRRQVAELQKERNELLTEKSALTGRVVDLQQFLDMRGISLRSALAQVKKHNKAKARKR